VRIVRHLALFVALLGFWLLLSGRLDPHLVGSGVVAAAVITFASAPLFERTLGSSAEHPRMRLWRWVPLAVWLTGRMAVSAVQLARIVLDPRVPPAPGIVRFRTQLRSPSARTVLANAITLVPGTMTLDVVDDELTVHSFTPDAIEDVATAALQNRIAAVFGDERQEPPALLWDSGHTLEGHVLLEEQPPHREGPFDGQELP
jgi:multicomponent Na+:H+ antiporter subunit E